jgi:hypothetical protein
VSFHPVLANGQETMYGHAGTLLLADQDTLANRLLGSDVAGPASQVNESVVERVKNGDLCYYLFLRGGQIPASNGQWIASFMLALYSGAAAYCGLRFLVMSSSHALWRGCRSFLVGAPAVAAMARRCRIRPPNSSVAT